MIPPGVHFVHWNAVNTVHSQVGPRSGFFHDFAAGECVVKRSVCVWEKSEIYLMLNAWLNSRIRILTIIFIYS